jgi:hypothetical protein
MYIFDADVVYKDLMVDLFGCTFGVLEEGFLVFIGEFLHEIVIPLESRVEVDLSTTCGLINTLLAIRLA